MNEETIKSRASIVESISDLKSGIKSLIRSRIDGSIDIDSFRQEYRILNTRFNDLRLSIDSIFKLEEGFIKGLLYNHNISNSAYITGLYVLEDSGIKSLVYSGDRLLETAIPEILKKNIDEIITSRSIGISIGKDSDMHKCHVLCFSADYKIHLMACISSSADFSISIYKNLSNAMEFLVREKSDFYSARIFDYFSDTWKLFKKRITLNNSGSLKIDQYKFLLIKQSFRHIGIDSLGFLIDRIYELIRSEYPERSEIYMFSPVNYAVVYRIDSQDSKIFEKKYIEFDFRGYRLPYKKFTYDSVSAIKIYSL
jgi:hypothetical protein